MEKQSKSFSVKYVGQGISLNDFYKGGHWSIRKRIKDKYAVIFTAILSEVNTPKDLDCFSVSIAYNSRHDIDNVIGMEKVFIDTLKRLNIIIDDSPKYFKKLDIRHDKSLEKNCWVFTVNY